MPVPGSAPFRIVGPPDVSASLPADSLRAAETEFDFLHVRFERAVAEDAALAQSIAAEEPQLAATRRHLDELTASRRKRAGVLYRQLAGAMRLHHLLLLGSVSPEAATARRIELNAAADHGEQRRTRKVEHALREIETRLASERQRRRELTFEIADTNDRLIIVLNKVNAARAVITLAGAEVPAAPGPSPIATAARDVELAFDAATSAQQAADAALYRAAAAPVDSALVATSWIATATATTARATLTRLRFALAHIVAQLLHGDGALLDAIWAATPAPAFLAVLFALSQVGKPYVYATSGPDTYDCSGLTKRAWAETGVGLPHFSGAQLHVSLPVDPVQLRPGDLLTYGPDGSEHVVLYIGNGWVVQAQGRSSGVVVTPANVDPLRGFAGASRPIP
jgi:cell wall-associated NlpC family hydrolase